MNSRTLALTIGISLLSGFCGGAAFVAGLALTPSVAARLRLKLDTVTAHRFVLIDDAGDVVVDSDEGGVIPLHTAE
jgi:hypothetical protein